MTDDEANEAARRQRGMLRWNIHRIWQKVRSGSGGKLSEAEKGLARILKEHAEYSDHFENSEILDGRTYEAGAEFNPFLHISMHCMAEAQLQAGKPPEARRFYDAMRERGCGHHEIVHRMILILLHLLQRSAAAGRPLDERRYRAWLQRCTGLDPAEMERLIAEESSDGHERNPLH